MGDEGQSRKRKRESSGREGAPPKATGWSWRRYRRKTYLDAEQPQPYNPEKRKDPWTDNMVEDNPWSHFD